MAACRAGEDDSAAIVGCLYRKLSGRGLERLPMVRWLLPHRGARGAAFRACGGQSIRGPGIASATLARLSSYQGSADVMTLPYAEVIGDPIAHSKSPLIHGFWLAKLGIDAEYRRTLVRPDALPEWLEERRADPMWRGANLTIPHKEKILPLVQEPEGLVSSVGAMNIVIPDHGEAKEIGRGAGREKGCKNGERPGGAVTI